MTIPADGRMPKREQRRREREAMTRPITSPARRIVTARGTILEGDDLQWLYETHLRAYAALRPATVIAVLEGNEDCPDVVSVYTVDHVRAPYLRFECLTEDPRDLVFVGVRPTPGGGQ
jgi:hypothetical protein